MEEAGDEPLFCERAAGIHIGKQLVSVTIRCPATPAGRRSRKRGSSAPPAASCWRWRTGCAAAGAAAGMEATSDYWKPVYFLLEREAWTACSTRRRRSSAARRPKTDRLDSAWLARITGRDPWRQLRAPGGHPPAAPAPATAAADPGPHRGEGALREAAGGRAPEAVVGDQRHPRRVRPRHAARHHRRRARPRSPRAEGATRMRRKIAQLRDALDCSFFTPATPSSCR